ncbi:APC family permease [Brevibacterium sp.]|uniref:APC family permease n=1 Tax=Brevibacterium sp. TaxID=1701 RepID=UPI0025BD6BEC|nr:APC family permease [Brevibacterium sp.]
MAVSLNQDQLKRTIGLPGALGVTINQVIGGGIVSLTRVAIGITGGGTPWAYIIAVITIILVSIPYASMASALPTVGGTYTWPARVVHPRLGFLNMWLALMQQCALSLYGLSAGIYLNSLADFFDPVVVAVVIVSVFYVANLMGAAFSSRVGVWLMVLMLLGFSVFIIAGFGHIEWNAYPEPLPHGFTQLLSAAALLTFATMGSFGVAELGREMKNPARDIPLAMIGGTLIVGLLYVLISIPAVGVLPIAEVSGQPLSVVAAEIMPHGWWVFFILGGAMVAIVSTLNAQLLWGSKGLVAATDDGWLPAAFGRVNARFGTPHWILTALFVLGIAPALAGLDISVIGTAASALVQVMLIAILLVSLRMRYVMPEVQARAPFTIPAWLHWTLAVIGTAVNLYQIALLTADFTPVVWIALAVWLAVGVLITVLRYPAVARILAARAAAAGAESAGRTADQTAEAGAAPPSPRHTSPHQAPPR